MVDIVNLITNNGIGIVCVAYLIYFQNTTMKENVLAGAVGAFLFALVGGILWFVLYQLGYLAAISGLVGVICAVKGYTFFAKTKNEKLTRS